MRPADILGCSSVVLKRKVLKSHDFRTFWSVRPIEIFAEIHDFQGFAGLHPLFFGVFAAMAVDFPPEGQF